MQIIYTDGACKGNGQKDSNKDGGWGVFILGDDKVRCVWGSDTGTSNNRMELVAIIQALTLSDPNQPTIIHSDSEININNCKKCQEENWETKGFKNGKTYKGAVAANVDLIKEANELLKGRSVEFVKVEGHSGDTGNEMADVLSTLGAEQQDCGDICLPSQTSLGNYLTALSNHLGKKVTLSKASKKHAQTPPNKTPTPKKTAGKSSTKQTPDTQKTKTTKKSKTAANTSKTASDGERLLIFDTETTGLHPYRGDRIVEIGVLEMVGRQLTGNKRHYYLNPERAMPEEAYKIHGLSDEFLADKPLFADIANDLYDFMAGATLVAHNAAFDMRFLIHAFDEALLPPLLGRVNVIDTVALAKAKDPKKSAKLDALVERFEVPKRDRSYHGALLDSEILADVYLAMTGGQGSLTDADSATTDSNATLDLASLYVEYYQQKPPSTTAFDHTSDDGTQMMISPATRRGEDERWLIFDTETTGFDPKKGDRIVEIGIVELVERKATGNRVHLYLNPERAMPEEAYNIHGLGDEFLADKPLFADIAKPLYDFMAGAHLIAHNADFDMRFMVAEFAKAGFLDFDKVVTVTDSLALARKKYTGQGNTLDALVKRLGIPKRDRSYHGALLDSEILADVYLAMTGGQTSLDIDEQLASSDDGTPSTQTLTKLQALLVHSVHDDDGDMAWRQSVFG